MPGDVYALERVKGGRHAAIMRCELNTRAGGYRLGLGRSEAGEQGVACLRIEWRHMKTLVYLIGTGPGGPGLMTVRGQRCLEAADVVIYDRTVHPRVFDLAPRHAERIDVGRPAREYADQDAISFLLAEKAREGKVVARLKQGDPFIFDRGGEEALFLHEQGIPFEVVPGRAGGPWRAAYAGIPLTYPGGGDTLTFVRGHEAGNGERTKVAWAPLAKLDGTIVCYGGQADLRRVADELLATAAPTTTPPRSSVAARWPARRRRSARSAKWRRGSAARRSTARHAGGRQGGRAA